MVGALTNGVPRCFAVTAVSIDGFESARSATRGDTPRPDSRNQVLYAAQVQVRQQRVPLLGRQRRRSRSGRRVGPGPGGTGPDIDFAVDRDGVGALFLTPVRSGTGVEFYSESPVADLTSIDLAPCLPAANPQSCLSYNPTPIEAAPGLGYVFEMDGGDGFSGMAPSG